MSGVIYPRPLAPGDLVVVSAPSSGVPFELHERFDAAVDALRHRGLRVEVGGLANRGGLVPAPPAERAAELAEAFARPEVRAILPPWGGDLAVDLVDRLDWASLAADPTWFVGWSDISTLLLPLTILTGVATVHGANLMDEPWQLPEQFARWTDVVAAAPGTTIEQRSAPARRSRDWAGAWSDEPLDAASAYETPTRWHALDGAGEVRATGRLIGGCLETVSLLAGSPAGDVRGFAERHAPEGLIVYLEVSQSDAVTAARLLVSLRLAGWFEHANAVLIGRTTAPDAEELTQRGAVELALGGLGIPVVLDVDTGHQPPQLPLVNGAVAEVVLQNGSGVIRQTLVP